jgi:hypothetical protein
VLLLSSFPIFGSLSLGLLLLLDWVLGATSYKFFSLSFSPLKRYLAI